MALAQKKYLTCSVCGRTSPPGEFAAEVQQLARDEGWLVGKRGHNVTDALRARGLEDYCPDHRGPHELIYCEAIIKTGEKCSHEAIVTLTRGETQVYSCAFHEWVMVKELLVALRGTEVTVKLIDD